TLPPGLDHPTRCAARQSWWMRARLLSGFLLLPPAGRQPAFAPAAPVRRLLEARSFVQEIDASFGGLLGPVYVPSSQYSLFHFLDLSTKCPYTNSSENSTHLNSRDWMFGSIRRYKGILIFQGRVNTFGSSIVASYIRWYGDKGV